MSIKNTNNYINTLSKDVMNIETIMNTGYTMRALETMQLERRLPNDKKEHGIIKYLSYFTQMLGA